MLEDGKDRSIKSARKALFCRFAARLSQEQLGGGEAALSRVMCADLTPANCCPGSFPPPKAVGDVHIEGTKAAHAPAQPQGQASVRPPMEKGASGHFTGDRERFR